MAGTALWGAIGVAVGALVRNQVGAIIARLAWGFVVENLLFGLVPSVGRFGPVHAGDALIGLTPEHLLHATAGGLSSSAGWSRSRLSALRSPSAVTSPELGLAQPTTTLLVKRMEEQGLVRRERQTHDQRVVLVWLTEAGEAALADLRGLAAAGLHKHLDAMPDAQLAALAAATDALAELITTLQSATSRQGARV